MIPLRYPYGDLHGWWWVYDRELGRTIGFPFRTKRAAEWAARHTLGTRR